MWPGFLGSPHRCGFNLLVVGAVIGIVDSVRLYKLLDRPSDRPALHLRFAPMLPYGSHGSVDHLTPDSLASSVDRTPLRPPHPIATPGHSRSPNIPAARPVGGLRCRLRQQRSGGMGVAGRRVGSEDLWVCRRRPIAEPALCRTVDGHEKAPRPSWTGDCFRRSPLAYGPPLDMSFYIEP